MKFPEQFRWANPGTPYNSKEGDPFGLFEIPAHKAPGRRLLRVVACRGEEGNENWDHASVSLGPTSKTPPTWDEMCFVKNLFWEETEWAVQYHPAKSSYVNLHKSTLHLWHNPRIEFPKPPQECV
jgi:hypothetical protein